MAVFGVMAMAASLPAQDAKPAKPAKEARQAGVAREAKQAGAPRSQLTAEQAQKQTENRLKQLTKQLSLTSEQQKKLEPILKEQTEKTRELMGKTDLTAQQRREQMTQMREKYEAKLKEILTSDQQKKFAELRQNTARQGRGQGDAATQKQGQRGNRQPPTQP